MNRPFHFHLSLSDLLVLACAVGMLVAFFAIPWYQLEDGSTVTGYQLAKDTEGDLDLPVRISHMFLVVFPFAAASAGLLALWGLIAPQYERTLPNLILAVGLVAVGYYFGAFFYENRQEELGAAKYAENGFYVALIAAAGLLVQYIIPRPDNVARLSLTRFERPSLQPPRSAWRWPFVALWGWLKAIIGWFFAQFRRVMADTPPLAYLFAFIAAAELERYAGEPFGRFFGFRKQPSLFGVDKILEPFSKLDFSGILAPFFPSPQDKYDEPLKASWESIRQLFDDFIYALSTHGTREIGFFDGLADVLKYDVVIFVIPVLLVALLLRHPASHLLRSIPRWLGILLQVIVLYIALWRWRSLNDYRELVLVYIGVNIMLAVSLNLINGYMGEFSVGHAGFMAVGAYVASVLTMWLFTDNKVFGDAVLPSEWGLPAGFIIALIAGGVAAALAGLLVAFPSFRTRGDYLAIVTLAVNFIVTGVINNIEAVGGPRGLNGVPLWTNFTWVFVVVVMSVWSVYALVSSTFGKGIIAIREDEIAAGLMGINTRRVKLVAFLVSSFIAGVSGGLLVHMLAYVNPGMFDIRKSTEALVMVYLGGMGSISGSVIAAVLYTLLIEAFRPLEVLKWVVIPLILIFLMFFRPQGLFGFREISLNLGGLDKRKKHAPQPEVSDDAAAD